MLIRLTASDDIAAAIDSALIDEPLELELASGVYRLDRPLVIPASRRGLTMRGAADGSTVLDGGCRLTGWVRDRINGCAAWRAAVPERAVSDGTVNQFFADGIRQKRSRWPESGDLTPAETFPASEGRLFVPTRSFRVKAGDFDPAWSEPAGIETVLFTKWVESRLPVESFDARENVLAFSRYSRFPADPEYARFHFENVKEALRRPGEYWFDRTARQLWWIPPEGVEPDSADTVVPAVGALLALDGGGEACEPGLLSGVRLENLTFRYGGAGFSRSGSCYDLGDGRLADWSNTFHRADQSPFDGLDAANAGQAAVQFPAVLMARGVRNAELSGCVVEHCGWYGLNIGPGSSDIAVRRCRFSDLGGGGIVISGAPSADTVRRRTGRVTVADCEIAHAGRLQHSAAGILIGHAFGNLIEHNHIHDLYYTGISCGWSWGYAEQVARENRIGFNHIHHLGQQLLCDMGGVYLLGIQPGTRVYNNLIHDVSCRFYGGWALYTDEGSAHMVLERNVCFNCTRDGYHQHYGRENIVRYNIFAFNANSALAITSGNDRRERYELPGTNYRNNLNLLGNVFLQAPGHPFFRAAAPLAVDPEQFSSDCNFFHGGSRRKFAQVGEAFLTCAEWRARGFDRHSKFLDPGFVSPEKRDFHLKPDSALRREFFPDPAETIDRAGIRSGKTV